MPESSPAVIELCIDDVWVALNYSLQDATPTEQLSTQQPLTDEQSPQNLQLNSLSEELLLSWAAPSTDGEVTSYNIACSTNIQSGNGQPITSLTLSLSTSDTSALLPVFGQELMEYTCCVTAQRPLEMFSPPTCGSVQVAPLPAPTGALGSILVPVLGVLVGVFFLALVLVSVALLVFMCTGTSKMKHNTVLLDGQELAEIPELEKE